MSLLVDDQRLGRLLRNDEDPGDDVYTTGYWYVRLCQAVLGAADRTGVLSTPFAPLRPEQRERATQGLIRLPAWIGLISLRSLAPAMGRLRQRHDLNVLGLEALAAAVELGAEVHLSARSPRLEAALRAEGCRVRVG